MQTNYILSFSSLVLVHCAYTENRKFSSSQLSDTQISGLKALTLILMMAAIHNQLWKKRKHHPSQSKPTFKLTLDLELSVLFEVQTIYTKHKKHLFSFSNLLCVALKIRDTLLSIYSQLLLDIPWREFSQEKQEAMYFYCNRVGANRTGNTECMTGCWHMDTWGHAEFERELQ